MGRKYTDSITGATDIKRYPSGNNFFIHNSGAGETLTVRFFKDNTEFHVAENVGKSYYLRDTDFQSVTVESSSAQTIEVEVSQGVSGSGVVGGEISTPQGDTVTASSKTVTGSATVLAAANTSRKALIINSLSTNTASVYIGGSGLTTSTGVELQPGQSISIGSGDGGAQAAWYGRISAVSQTIRVIEIT